MKRLICCILFLYLYMLLINFYIFVADARCVDIIIMSSVYFSFLLHVEFLFLLFLLLFTVILLFLLPLLLSSLFIIKTLIAILVMLYYTSSSYEKVSHVHIRKSGVHTAPRGSSVDYNVCIMHSRFQRQENNAIKMILRM